jgi:hypothetical protein
VPRYANRKAVGGSFFGIVPERLLYSPALTGLRDIRSLGLYFVMVGRSDAYGCVQGYDSLSATHSVVMTGISTLMSPRLFKDAMIDLVHTGAIVPLLWNGLPVFLLPHKLVTAVPSYYPTPRVMPVKAVAAHIREIAGNDPWLRTQVEAANLDEIVANMDDGVPCPALGTVMMPEWLAPREQVERIKVKVAKEAARARIKRAKQISLPENLPLQTMIPDLPDAVPEHKTVNDLRVADLQQYIVDEGYDILVPDDDLLTLVIRFGTDYTRALIDRYGSWRINNRKKASTHTSHYHAMRQGWVPDEVNKSGLLPNPNDSMIRVRNNVLVSKPDKKDLISAIRTKLKVSEENAEQWFQTFSERVSGMKLKGSIYGISEDANFILEKLETQVKYGS